MKILQMHLGLSLMGGVESVIIGLTNEFSKQHEVSICTIFEPKSTDIYYTRLEESVRRTNLGVPSGKFSFSTLSKIYKYIKSCDANIIHIHSCFYYYALSILLLHNRKKFVYTFHSDAFMENQKWDKRILWIKKIFLKLRWITPVTISKPSQDSFLKLYKIPSTLIENGIKRAKIDKYKHSFSQYKYTSNTRIFIHPGRISEPKNQIVLVRVFERLIKEGHDVVLLIAGTKQNEQIYNTLKSYFNERIIYIGERNDVTQLLSEADGFCLPSIWEGLPVTLLESLSVGCIPICSPVGGIPSVITNYHNGLLSKSSNEEDYYSVMKEFLKLDSVTLLSLKNAAITTFADYDIEICVRKYYNLYKKIINE